MQVKYRRNDIYGAINIEVEAYNTQSEGAAILGACTDKSGLAKPGTAISLNSLWKTHCEALFILGGRRSIIASLRLEGSSPAIGRNAGSDALYAWFFRKKHSFGKNQTLIVISASRSGVQAGGWDAIERIDLRYALGSTYLTPLGEVTPDRLADICERLL